MYCMGAVADGPTVSRAWVATDLKDILYQDDLGEILSDLGAFRNAVCSRRFSLLGCLNPGRHWQV